MLHVRSQEPDDESIGDLFHQLIEDGRGVIAAEVGLYKEIARYRAAKAKSGIAALAIAVVLLLLGAIALVLGVVLALATLIGPLGAGLVVLAFCAVGALLLVRFGLGKLGALSGDAEEKSALKAGEAA